MSPEERAREMLSRFWDERPISLGPLVVETIRAASADARREALEEAARAIRDAVVPFERLAAVPWPAAREWAIRHVRALASQKGTP